MAANPTTHPNGWQETGNRNGDAYEFGVSLGLYTVSGHIWNDVNGLTDGYVNGVATNLPSGLYAHLVDINNNPFAVVAVSNGTYSFADVVAGDYTVVLNTSSGNTAPDIANTTLPTATTNGVTQNWLNTGEHLGLSTIAGSDGTINGKLAISVGKSSTQQNVTDADFGIEFPPTSGGGVTSDIPNPGGTRQYTLTGTAFTQTGATSTPSSDPTPGAVTGLRITAFPTGATSIVIGGITYHANVSSEVTSLLALTLTTDASGNPSASYGITVDPAANGGTAVDIPFVTVDAANKPSANTGHAVLNFVDLTISGTVHDDANGGTIDGPVTGTAGGVQLYVNLLVNNGIGYSVQASRTLTATGTYLFGNADGVEANSAYRVVLSTSATGTAGLLPTALPGNRWVNTAEGDAGTAGDGATDGINGAQAINTVTSIIVDKDFGIDQLPVADNKLYTVGQTDYSKTPPANFPTVSGYKSIPASSAALTGNTHGGNLTATDGEDCSTAASCYTGRTFRITLVNANTKLYYNFSATATPDVRQVTASSNSDITNFDPARLVIYGQKATNSVTAVGGGVGFNYAMVDAASKAGSTASYQINSVVLPVKLISFDAKAVDCRTQLSWTVATESNLAGYDVEFSETAGEDFRTVVSVAPMGSNSSYSASYTQAVATGYYRLKMTDYSGETAYSNTVPVTRACGNTPVVSLYPNPTTGAIHIEGLQSGTHIAVYDVHGKVLMTADAADAGVTSLDLSALAPGMYQIVTSKDGEARHALQVIRR